MARKPSRIKLNRGKEDRYKVALIYPEDHANITPFADRIRAARPGTKCEQVADVVHEAFRALDEKLQGA